MIRPSSSVSATRGMGGAALFLALLLVASGTSAASDRNGDRLFDDLEVSMATARTNQPLDVIVRYRPGSEAAATTLGRRLTARLSPDRSVTARLTAGELRRLARSGAVESIEADLPCRLFRETAGASFGATRARVDFALSGDGDGNPASYSPRDLTIAVIDTGLDARHPDFAGGKVIAWKDFVADRPEPYDDDGHGTHVAGIAAGAPAAGAPGVAPGAALVGLKVTRRPAAGGEETARTSTVIQAIDWCVENRARLGIDVLNLSLGDDTSSSGVDAKGRAIDRAVAAGIVVCVAAGNAGPGLHTIGSPAACANALTVGSMADLGEGGFHIAPSSSRGPTADGRVKPDLCAPGVRILSAQANGAGYKASTGTSMASPFVAGVVALMLQANPSLSPGEVKELLKATAVHFGPAGENNDYGAGRLDAYAVLAKVTGRHGTAPETPEHLFGRRSLTASDDRFTWVLPVDDLAYPIAVTMLQENLEADFDLYVFDPDRRLVVDARGNTRQETISFRPARPGSYSILVHSHRGAGDYTLDVSAGTHVTGAARR